MPGMSYAQDQAMKAADKRLKDAAIFASLNIKNPIFQRRIGKGYSAALVRLDWPGVLTVLDPETGKILAVSEPGRPDVLQGEFVPGNGTNYQCGS